MLVSPKKQTYFNILWSNKYDWFTIVQSVTTKFGCNACGTIFLFIIFTFVSFFMCFLFKWPVFWCLGPTLDNKTSNNKHKSPLLTFKMFYHLWIRKQYLQNKQLWFSVLQVRWLYCSILGQWKWQIWMILG